MPLVLYFMPVRAVLSLFFKFYRQGKYDLLFFLSISKWKVKKKKNKTPGNKIVHAFQHHVLESSKFHFGKKK